MGGGDELNPTLGDGAGGRCFQLGAHLVDDDNLGHVVLHGFDHHRVLVGRGNYLHPAGTPDGAVGHVTVTGYFVGGVYDDHPFLGVFRQHTGHLSQHGGLAHAGAS